MPAADYQALLAELSGWQQAHEVAPTAVGPPTTTRDEVARAIRRILGALAT